MRPPAIGSTSSILAAAFVLVAAATVGCSSHHKRKPPAEVCAQEPAVAYSTDGTDLSEWNPVWGVIVSLDNVANVEGSGSSNDCTVTLSYQVFSEDLLTLSLAAQVGTVSVNAVPTHPPTGGSDWKGGIALEIPASVTSVAVTVRVTHYKFAGKPPTPPPGRSRNVPVHLKLSQLEVSG